MYPYFNYYRNFNDPYQFRAFSNQIGQFYTIPKSIPLPNGYTLPPQTRVFIHTVSYLPSGEESIIIVFPMQLGGACVAGSATVNASQLSGSPVGTY